MPKRSPGTKIFFRMGNVFITGASGFVGANLTHRLVREKQDVHVLVRPESDLWRLGAVKKYIAIHRADLSDAHAIRRIIKRVRPGFVYHTAAHGLFLKQDEAEQMVSSNVLGTVHLLEALLHAGTAECIIHVGSFAEYDPDDAHIQEDSLLRPSNAYGASKASQSFFAQYYARQHKMPVVIVRPSLLYGPFEERRRLVPASVLAHVRLQPLHLSSPKPRKDFLFVEDAVDAFLAASQHALRPGEVINIGVGREYSIREVVKNVQQCTGVKVPLIWGALEGRPWDSARKHSYATEKAARLLGWHPRYALEQGIGKTVDWFRSHIHLYA